MRWFSFAWLAWAALVAAPALADEPRVVVVEDSDIEFTIAEAGDEMPDHWLGVHCMPADDTLKSHLDLKQGLVVHHVMPDSPAAKAGVKQHDVLLSLDGKELNDPGQLVKLVGELKDKEVSLEMIRGGKKQAVKITAAKRPEGVQEFNLPVPPLGHFPGKLDPEVNQFFQKFAAPGQDHVRMRILHPGMVTAKLAEIPKDLSVQITRKGEEPAKIVVKKGDKTWEVTDKELDKLPEEIRAHVARMSNGSISGDVIRWTAPAAGTFHVAPPIAVAPMPVFGHAQAVPAVPGVPGVRIAPPVAGNIEYRVIGAPGAQELEKKVKDLQERVEALEKQLKK